MFICLRSNLFCQPKVESYVETWYNKSDKKRPLFATPTHDFIYEKISSCCCCCPVSATSPEAMTLTTTTTMVINSSKKNEMGLNFKHRHKPQLRQTNKIAKFNIPTTNIRYYLQVSNINTTTTATTVATSIATTSGKRL